MKMSDRMPVMSGANGFSAPRDNTARASCGNEAKRNFLSVFNEKIIKAEE